MKQTFVLVNPQVVDRTCSFIRALPPEPVHEVSVKEHRSKRSLDQNRLHFKRLDVLRLHIADSTGQVFSAEELHDFFKTKFLDVKLVTVGEESIPVRRTTTGMDTKEFSDFMDQIDRYCVANLGIYLPVPGMPDDY